MCSGPPIRSSRILYCISIVWSIHYHFFVPQFSGYKWIQKILPTFIKNDFSLFLILNGRLPNHRTTCPLSRKYEDVIDVSGIWLTYYEIFRIWHHVLWHHVFDTCWTTRVDPHVLIHINRTEIDHLDTHTKTLKNRTKPNKTFYLFTQNKRSSTPQIKYIV